MTVCLLISITDLSVPETGGTATFTVTLDRAPTGADTVIVNFSTADGTATGGTDYATTSGALTFNSGTGASLTIDVTINNDQIVERPDEDFYVNLSAGSANVTVLDSQATCVIVDNDYTVTFDTATVGPGPVGARR